MHKLGGVGQVEIDQLSAVVTDGVIVAIGFAIVATGAVTKIYLVNQSGFFQVAQRVIDRCVADTGQAAARSFKDLAGGRVIVSLLNHLKHRFSLGSQLWLLLYYLHDGFRLILNHRFVKRSFCAFLWLELWMLAGEVDYLIDVTQKGRTADAMRREEGLRLAGIVELPHKEVRNGVMR